MGNLTDELAKRIKLTPELKEALSKVNPRVDPVLADPEPTMEEALGVLAEAYLEGREQKLQGVFDQINPENPEEQNPIASQ